jgi:hypothetical protein
MIAGAGLIEGALAKAAVDTYEKREGTVGGGGRVMGYNFDTSLEGLKLDVTIEDPKVHRPSDRPCHLPSLRRFGYKRYH